MSAVTAFQSPSGPHRGSPAPAPRGPLAGASGGFTLIELMVAVAIVALLGSVAMPAYMAYVKRAKVPPGLDALSAYFTRMEQRFQDAATYVNTTDNTKCAIQPLPTASNYTFSCTLSGGGTGYTLVGTGSGALSGYSYSINYLGVRATTAHPNGVPSTSCWSIRGATCDS